jgi:bla regulator protein BlaR1
MKYLFVNLIPENWLHAIGAALFHSLWIGVVLSVVTALILSASRKSSSALRYKLLVGCLLLFVAGVGASFIYELNNVATTSINSPVVAQVNAQQVVAQPIMANTPVSNEFGFKINGLMDLWNTYSVQIVMIWFLIICAKSIHLWVGLSGIAFLKKNQTFDAGKFWEVKTIEIGHKLGMSKAIKLVQSGIAKVPMVVGHFKPVILLPLGLINGLSIAEVEAILAHELAHVKRRDYLVNLLQNLLEIVFFFNPAVLWMSKLIRTEREHCCDDLALQCVGDKKNYVNALLYCQEFQVNTPAYAMALTGGKNQLLNRVKRMLFDTRTTLNKMEKAVLTIALVTLFIFSAAFTQVHSAIATGSLNNMSFFQDKPKKQQETPPTKKSKSKPKAKPVNKSVRTERHTITEDGVVIQDMSRQVTVEDKSRYVADSINYEKHNKLFKENQAKYGQNNANYKREQEEYKRREQDYKRDQQQYELHKKEFSQREKKYNTIADSVKRRTNRNSRLDSAKARLSPLSRPLPITQATPITPTTPITPITPLRGNLNVPANVNPPATPATPKTNTNVNRTKESISLTDGGDLIGKDFSDMVNREMIKDGIIKNTNNLNYRLDASNFIVNGNKLDKEIHQKYKAKYLKKQSTALLYNYEVSTK